MKDKEVEDQEMQDKQNFSERCKNAIEKSYGFKIPLPKSIVKIENKNALLVKLMSKDQLLDALKSKIGDDKKIIHAITKIEREKRLSSEEFLKVHDVLRKEGPFVKYRNPNSWNKEML